MILARKILGHIFFDTLWKKRTMQILIIPSYQPIYLIFGKESTGVDRKLLAKHLDNCYRIPTTDKVRSLNLSNAVAIVSYEVFRQFNYENLISVEPETHKGKVFINFLEDV